MSPNLKPESVPQQAIQLSEQEQREGRISPENRALAAAVIACRGYVILRNAVPMPFVQTLRQEFDDILADCLSTMNNETDAAPDAVHQVTKSPKKQASFWFRKSRWRIFPKLVGPMGDPMLLANPFVVPILEDLLGEDYTCQYLTSDTCSKGSILQSPHSDILMDDVFVENHWKARGYVVNVPIMECGLHNGPLEVWPGGSHLWTTDILNRSALKPYVQDGRNPPVEKLAEFFPSIKVVLQPGEILIRDLAMWHRGTPNETDEPRTMMTIGFFRGGYTYGYGDPSYNVDREVYENLPPRIKRMFEYHFRLRRRLGRLKRQVQSQAKTAIQEWKKSRFG